MLVLWRWCCGAGAGLVLVGTVCLQAGEATSQRAHRHSSRRSHADPRRTPPALCVAVSSWTRQRVSVVVRRRAARRQRGVAAPRSGLDPCRCKRLASTWWASIARARAVGAWRRRRRRQSDTATCRCGDLASLVAGCGDETPCEGTRGHATFLALSSFILPSTARAHGAGGAER